MTPSVASLVEFFEGRPARVHCKRLNSSQLVNIHWLKESHLAKVSQLKERQAVNIDLSKESQLANIPQLKESQLVNVN